MAVIAVWVVMCLVVTLTCQRAARGEARGATRMARRSRSIMDRGFNPRHTESRSSTRLVVADDSPYDAAPFRRYTHYVVDPPTEWIPTQEEDDEEKEALRWDAAPPDGFSSVRGKRPLTGVTQGLGRDVRAPSALRDKGRPRGMQSRKWIEDMRANPRHAIVPVGDGDRTRSADWAESWWQSEKLKRTLSDLYIRLS